MTKVEARFLTFPSVKLTAASDSMGSKRPEQIHTGLSTDFKTRTDDEHIHEEDKQHLHEERGKLATPKGENPALKSVKAKKRRKSGRA
jgi:hypothetical protein